VWWGWVEGVGVQAASGGDRTPARPGGMQGGTGTFTSSFWLLNLISKDFSLFRKSFEKSVFWDWLSVLNNLIKLIFSTADIWQFWFFIYDWIWRNDRKCLTVYSYSRLTFLHLQSISQNTEKRPIQHCAMLLSVNQKLGLHIHILVNLKNDG